MSELRAEVLKKQLKQERFGTVVRASLSPRNATRIKTLRARSGRYYKDIFRVLLSVFREHPEKFMHRKKPGRSEVIAFRLSRELALFSADWAWERGQKRAYFFNSIVEDFFGIVPMREAVKVFKEQMDRVARILSGGESV